MADNPANAQILKINGKPDINGVYKAKIGVTDPQTGQTYTKDSTMFPSEWSKQQVLDEVHAVMADRPPVGGVAQGISPSGVPIRVVYGDNGAPRTAYPVWAGRGGAPPGGGGP